MCRLRATSRGQRTEPSRIVDWPTASTSVETACFGRFSRIGPVGSSRGDILVSMGVTIWQPFAACSIVDILYFEFRQISPFACFSSLYQVFLLKLVYCSSYFLRSFGIPRTVNIWNRYEYFFCSCCSFHPSLLIIW